MTCFIDSSAWVAIADENHSQHRNAQEYFRNLLESNVKVVTNNIAVDLALASIKEAKGNEAARHFLGIIDESILTINLRMDWISRRIRRACLNRYVNEEDSSLSLNHFYLYESIRRKNADIIFSFDSRLVKFGLPIMPQSERES